MNKYLSPNSQQQLDSYEAEIVEDIPEQFDLSRYKKSNKLNGGQFAYARPPPFPPNQQAYLYHQQQQQQQPYNNYMQSLTTAAKQQISSKGLDSTSTLTTALIAPQLPPQFYHHQYQYQHQQPSQTPHQPQQQQQQQQQQQPQPHQQQAQFLTDYNQQIHQLVTYYPKNEYDLTPSQQQMTSQYVVSQTNTLMKKKSSSVPRYLPEMSSYLPETQTLDYVEDQQQQQQQQPSPHKTLTRHPIPVQQQQLQQQPQQQQQQIIPKMDTGRKKNSFEDDDESDIDPFVKKEYYLKGGETVVETLRIATGEQTVIPQQTGSNSNTLPKSNLKGAMKKPGVTFDEKLEVYEVKNPHYGLEIKSEKREQKKKKKDKQKEDELTFKTKLDLKAKIQNQNMIHYYFYEKSLIYNCLSYYEENFYKQSIIKLQDKLRTNKPDEKLRDQLNQMVEKDNSITIDIIRHVKKDYLNKLEPYLNQYQTTVDKLHTIPGMYQIMQTAANSVNYTEIITFCINRDSVESPSGFRKILGGHEARIDKHLTNQIITVKTPLQRKSDLWMPKYVIAAIDMHVREISNFNLKSLTELIYKLNEICENDLNFIRALYKYVLITQLEALRRNETGSILMRHYELGLETTNTIFSRLCSFAGIENHIVKGLWKTIAQDPGEKVEVKSVWNIVNLECGWRFIQPAFTPIKYFNRSDLGYEETEFYFLSDFDSLFHEFLPTDKQCLFNDLLISNPKEYAKEFEKKPIVTPQFRVLQLTILHSNYTLANIGKEPFKLAIKYPADYADSIIFKYTLKPIQQLSLRNQSILNSENTTNYEYNASLYVISELISDENAIVFKISALPEVGNYNFTVYAALIDSDVVQTGLSTPVQPLATTFLPLLSQETKAVLSFRLQCSKVTHFEIPPNRINEINVFGTNLIMKRLGLTCCDFKQGVLGTDREGKLNLVFEMSQPLEVEAYLYSSDASINSKYLELCMLKRIVHNFLIIIINPPHAGLYGLDLHGATKGAFNSMLSSQPLPAIGKFLIKSHHQIRSFYQFPKGDNRQWGPKQRFYDLGLHTVGNIDPYLVNEDGKQVEIEIAMLKSVTIWYKFDFDHNGSPKAIDQFCFMNYKNSNRKEKTVSFLLRFPYRGFYHLALMANDDVFPTKPDEIVYNYLIRVQDPSSEVEEFPNILNPILWKNCCLIAPKNVRLNSYDVHFSIIVPKTSQVQIATKDRVLDKLEPREIENSWVGLVSINDNSKFIYIEAEFDNKFKKLIRFKGLYNSSKE